jgi:hypothetical protein
LSKTGIAIRGSIRQGRFEAKVWIFVKFWNGLAYIGVRAVIDSRAEEGDELVAALVHDEAADWKNVEKTYLNKAKNVVRYVWKRWKYSKNVENFCWSSKKVDEKRRKCRKTLKNVENVDEK